MTNLERDILHEMLVTLHRLSLCCVVRRTYNREHSLETISVEEGKQRYPNAYRSP